MTNTIGLTDADLLRIQTATLPFDHGSVIEFGRAVAAEAEAAVLQRVAAGEGAETVRRDGSISFEEAQELARKHAKAEPESYYSEPFEPHLWVINAVLEASAIWYQRAVDERIRRVKAERTAAPAPSAPPEPAYPASKAIEFAEYMAQRAGHLIDAINWLAAAELNREESDNDTGQVEDARDAVTERVTGLRSAVYEFRKRAEKVAPEPAPVSAAAGEPWPMNLTNDALISALKEYASQETCPYRGELNEAARRLGTPPSPAQSPAASTAEAGARFDHVECQDCGAHFVCEKCGCSEPEIIYSPARAALASSSAATQPAAQSLREAARDVRLLMSALAALQEGKRLYEGVYFGGVNHALEKVISDIRTALSQAAPG